MSDPHAKDTIFKRAKHLTRRAWAQLYWETYAPVLALALLAICVFLIGSFGGAWDRIGDPWRLIALVAVLVYLVRGALAARKSSRPSRSAAKRRVEQDSGQAHRPLDTIYDTPALSRSVWPQHYRNAVTAVTQLKPSSLRPALGPIDPYYLRFLIPFALMLAFMVGFGDNRERLRRALSPTWQAAMNPSDLQFDAWIDPPDYTGRPPVYFKDKRTLSVPAGSEIVARISGSRSAPRLKLSTAKRSQYLPLKRLDAKSFETRAVLTDTAQAEWRIGSLRQIWNLTVVEDQPPQINFDEPPKADKRDRLAFSLTFEDDYGVEALELEMRRITDDPENTDIETVSVPLPSASVKRQEKNERELDLTKHKWAGQKVSAQIIARDGLGQTAKTETVYFTIPNKIFVEPLAKAVIEHRRLILAGSESYAPPKRLTRKEYYKRPLLDPDDARNRLDRAPADIQRAVVLIDAITENPSGVFQDPVIYMGLRHVSGRLRYARGQDDLAGTPEDLWSIALRAEFGTLGTALENMRRAEQSLREGMARRAPQREIDTLFDRYNESVDRYMEVLRQQALKDGNFADAGAGGAGGGRNTDQIEDLLKAIEEANRLGDAEGARKALARLAELLENMKIELARGQGQGDGEAMPGELSEEMREALEDMADLLGDQRELKDETEQAERDAERQAQASENAEDGDEQAGTPPGGGTQEGEAGNGSQPGDDGPRILTPSELAAQQQLLEEALEKLAGALPDEDSPESESGAAGGEETGEGAEQSAEQALEDAGNAMAESGQALENDQLGIAQLAQDEAIAALRRAGRALAEQAQAQNGEGNSSLSAESEGETDPLGRTNNGDNDESFEADIEQKDDKQRSRELLEELRRRASEQEREKIERDYLERLLKRF